MALVGINPGGLGRSVPVPVPVLPGALSEYCPEQRSEPPGRGPLFPSPSPPVLAVLFALVSAVPVGAITALAGPARCPRASLSRCGGTADLPRLSAGSTGSVSRAGSLRRERLGSDRIGRGLGPGVSRGPAGGYPRPPWLPEELEHRAVLCNTRLITDHCSRRTAAALSGHFT